MRRLVLGLLAGVLVLTGLTACRTGGSATRSLLVETEAGTLKGKVEDGIRTWRGIPYAAPPVDGLRWEPPQPVQAWDGTREATQYSDACTQAAKPQGAGGQPVAVAPDSSEDCLYLNVNAPAHGEGHPVIVWIHGGGFIAGSGNLPVTNSPAMVERDVVLVTLNYRLGRFGFFAHPALGGEVANYGLLDQVAALEWVRDNIEAFGGDPDNITVAGQSAGAVSVNALMTSPKAEGLFDKAISQSGLGREPALPMDLVAARNAKAYPADTAEQLRELDADQLLAPGLNILRGQVPLLDAVLPERVADAFAAGTEADVPYLLGTTDLEFPDSIFRLLGQSAEALRRAFIGDRREAFLDAYGSEEQIDLHVLSDAIFSEPARLLADEHSGDAPTYRYRFSITTDQLRSQVGGATHASETSFVFDQPLLPEFAEMADQICDYWVSFARDGDPDHDDAPHWPEAEDGALMLLRNSGATAASEDPWADRLDVVQAANEQHAVDLPTLSP